MAWLNDDEDDLYGGFDTATPSRNLAQPTPPAAPKPPAGGHSGGAPPRSPQMEWLKEGAGAGGGTTSPSAAPNPPPPSDHQQNANGSFSSPFRQNRVLSPATNVLPVPVTGGGGHPVATPPSGFSSRNQSRGGESKKGSKKEKKGPGFLTDSSDEDDDDDEFSLDDTTNSLNLQATPPPPSSGRPPLSGRPNVSGGSARKPAGAQDSDTATGSEITPSQTPREKEKKEKKDKKKHKNGEIIELDIGGGGSAGGAAPPEALLRRLEKAKEKKPKKEKKEKKDDDDGREKKAKKDKIAKPKATRPKVDSTFITEGSPGGGANVAIGVGIGIEDQGNEVDLSVIPPLSDEDKVEFKSMIQFVSSSASSASSSSDTIAKLRSSKFQHRVAGVQEMTNKILDRLGSKPTQAVSMGFSLWKMTVNDKVVQVFTTAAESIGAVCKHVTFVDEDTLPEVQPVIAHLALKLRESNERTKKAAMGALESLATLKGVGAPMIVQSVCAASAVTSSAGLTASPSKGGISDNEGEGTSTSTTAGGSTESWKAVLARVEFLQEMVRSFGDKLVTATQATMISQAVIGLKCTNAKVRKETIDFTVKLYKMIGAGEMEKHLGEVSPGVMKVLKEALEGSNVLVDQGGAMGTVGDRQEDEDLAAFEAEGVSLSEDQQMIIRQWTNIMGVRSIKCLFCPRWKLRERFVGRLHTAINSTLISVQSPDAAKAFDSSKLIKIKDDAVKMVLAQICEKILGDAVPNVLQAGQLMVKTTVTLMQKAASQEFFGTKFAPGLIAPLVKQAGLSSATNEDICEQILIQDLASHPSLGPVAIYKSIAEATAGMAITKISVKILCPRLELLSSLVDACGFDGAPRTALKEDDVMTYTMKAFEHPQQKVRMAAVSVIIAVYKKAGNVIQPYLQGLKGALLDDLKQKISSIARKERSSTAPIQRLAGIVEPLGDPGAQSANTARPSTEDPAMMALRANRTAEDPSMKEKITRWHQQQGGGGGGGKKKGEVDDDGSPLGPNKSGGGGGLDDIEDDTDTNDEFDDAMDNAPVLNKNINGSQRGGVIRPGAARKNRLVFS